MAAFEIGSIRIADDAPPVVIAEIGANHDGSVEKAEQTVRAVAAAGARLVKFQLYTAEELVADAARDVTWGPPHRRFTEKIGAMFARLSLAPEAMRDLFALSRELGMEPFATPFSEAGADRLLDMGVRAFKIAASDVTHLPMLAHIARLGQPVILSLGKCTLAEADEAIECLRSNGCRELAILHCVATYPSPMNEMNLRVIPALKGIYPECVVGFSDHSIGLTAAIGAAALGARIVEKHVTLDKNAHGPDHWFSMDMHELKALCDAMRDLHAALGHPHKRVLPCEENGRRLAVRSLAATRELPAGTILKKGDLKAVRPGGGLPPKMMEVVHGLKICRPMRRDEQLTFAHFKDPS